MKNRGLSKVRTFRKLRSALVTGFEPFGKHRVNPSEGLARWADGRSLSRFEVVGRILPVSFRRAGPEILRLIREIRPDVVVMFGLAPKRDRVSVEVQALNVDHGEEADNDGFKPWRRLIRRGGPELVRVRAPVDRMVRSLRRARVPAHLSFHAGTHVCNHVLYVALRGPRRIPTAFIHVPPRRSRGELIRALKAVLDCL